MYNPFNQASTFLIQLVFDFYIFLVVLKIILQSLDADFYNPISQFVVTLTDPPINFLRRYFPMWQKIDMAAVALAFGLVLIKLFLVIGIKLGGFPDILGVILWSVGDIFTQAVNIFFYSTLAMALISWLAPTTRSPIVNLLTQITDPLFKLTRKHVPPLKGYDFSAIVILIALELITILVVHPLFQSGIGRVFNRFVTSVPTL